MRLLENLEDLRFVINTCRGCREFMSLEIFEFSILI